MSQPPPTVFNIGGWTAGSVQPSDVCSRFRVAGIASVDNAYVKGNHAFVTVSLLQGESSDAILAKLKKLYENTSWKGGKIHLDFATPDFMDRLRAEWAAVKRTIKETADASTTAAATPKAPEPLPSALRIRKKRGRRGTILVPAGNAFGLVDSDVATSSLPAANALPISQNLAYCCSGDAGPNFDAKQPACKSINKAPHLEEDKKRPRWTTSKSVLRTSANPHQPTMKANIIEENIEKIKNKTQGVGALPTPTESARTSSTVIGQNVTTPAATHDAAEKPSAVTPPSFSNLTPDVKKKVIEKKKKKAAKTTSKLAPVANPVTVVSEGLLMARQQLFGNKM